MRILLLTSLCLGLASSAVAQTGTAASRLAWDQPNATTAEAQALTYAVYADGATVGTVLTGVACVGAAPVCSAPFPAFTPGAHTVTLTAKNVAGESPKSAPLTFTFVVVPSAPATLRIQ